jgi:type IV secretion system protein VirB6
MSTPITDILDKLDAITQQYAFNGYAALAHTLQPSITMALVFYVAFLGWMTLQGWTKFTIGESVKHSLKIVIVFSLATNWDFFSLFIYNVFVHGPNEISEVLMSSTGKTSGSANAALQDSFNQGIDIGNQLFNLSSYLNKFLALVVWAFDICVTGFCLIGFAVAKVGLSVTLVLAPVFSVLLLWNGTKGIFEKWLMTALGFALTPLILTSVLLVVDALMNYSLSEITNSIANTSEESTTVTSVMTFILASIVSIALLKRAASIANAIAGGVTVSAMGVVGSAGNIAATASGAKLAGSIASAKLKKSIANKMKSNNSGYFRPGES